MQSLSRLEEYVFPLMAGISSQLEMEGIVSGWKPDKAKDPFAVTDLASSVSLLFTEDGNFHPRKGMLVGLNCASLECAMIICFQMRT